MKDHNPWKNEYKMQSILNFMMMIHGEKRWFPEVYRKIEISNGSIVASKGIVNRVFLKAMFFFLGKTQTEYFSLMKYAEGVAKAGIGPRNVAWQETEKVILGPWETP